MVLINTQTGTGKYAGLEVKYLLEIPRSGCVYCSARHRETGKTRIFLVFYSREAAYVRNGLRGTWDIQDHAEYDELRRIARDAAQNPDVPCYTTNRFEPLSVN